MKNPNIFKWIHNTGHAQGIFWSICACVFSNANDILIKLLSKKLPVLQITFFRFFLGTLIIVPIACYKGKKSFIMKNKKNHFVRIIIGFCATFLWIYGSKYTSLPSITVISFSCPLLVLFLAYIFLGEKSDWKRIFLVICGFLGVIFIAFFEKNGIEIHHDFNIHLGIIILFCAAILFAFSDIINKKMIFSESLFSLLLYFYIGATSIAIIPSFFIWTRINYKDFPMLFLLGIGGIMIVYCILKAAAATNISAISPYKYMEFIISIAMGYCIFNEVIKISTLIGACLIIPSAFFTAYYELRKEKMLPK